MLGVQQGCLISMLLHWQWHHFENGQIMIWYKFSFKILVIHYGNLSLDTNSWNKVNGSIQNEINFWGRLSLKRKKLIVKQTLLPKLWYIRWYSPSKTHQNRKWEKSKQFLLEWQRDEPTWNLVNIFIGGLGYTFWT